MALKRPFLHGTTSSYTNHKCRCARCRAAWADYIRNRARAAGRKPLNGDAYYTDRTKRTITIRPTTLGLRLLQAVQDRHKRNADDIFEQLLRKGAASLRFDESTGMLVAR